MGPLPHSPLRNICHRGRRRRGLGGPVAARAPARRDTPRRRCAHARPFCVGSALCPGKCATCDGYTVQSQGCVSVFDSRCRRLGVWIGCAARLPCLTGIYPGACLLHRLYMQVVSNSATLSSPSLVPIIASLFRAAAVMQLQGVLMPPACTGAYPFESEVSLMGIALGAWIICIAAYYSRSLERLGNLSPKVALCGRVALTVALVLYSSSANTAMSLLNCSALTTVVGSVTALDGGSAAAAAATLTTPTAAGRSAMVVVHVLQKNPYFVCWEGSHRAAGILAAATMALYIATLPVVLLGWSWKDPWLQEQLHQECKLEPETNPASCTCKRRRSDDVTHASGERFVQNPMRTRAVRHHGKLGASLATAPAGSGTSSPSPRRNDAPDTILQPVLKDYVPAAWYTKLADVLLLLVLALLRALVPRPTNVTLISMKAAVSCTFLLAVCAHVLLVRPYVPQQAWKNWVRALLLFDSAGCALLNAAVSALDAGLGGPRLRASVPVGSYILLVLCCITLVVLLWRFVVSVYAGLACLVLCASQVVPFLNCHCCTSMFICRRGGRAARHGRRKQGTASSFKPGAAFFL